MKCKVCDMTVSKHDELFQFPAGTVIHQRTAQCVEALLVENKRLMALLLKLNSEDNKKLRAQLKEKGAV